MALHPQSSHERKITKQAMVNVPSSRSTTGLTADEDELGEVDEPPDFPLRFSKLAKTGSQCMNLDSNSVTSPSSRKASLLSQALASPDLSALSDTEAPVLSSDGDLTSPARSNTPSPPIPPLGDGILAPLGTRLYSDSKTEDSTHQSDVLRTDRLPEIKVEEGLGRRRCISFACAQKSSPPAKLGNKTEATAPTKTSDITSTSSSKRPCMLTFVCPVRKVHEEKFSQKTCRESNAKNTHSNDVRSLDSVRDQAVSVDECQAVAPRDREREAAFSGSCATTKNMAVSTMRPHQRSKTFNRVDFQKSEATRFHEFASSFTEEDEWTNEQTAFRQKITISDTLRKENIIRKLAEEAEQEALDEERMNADDSAYRSLHESCSVSDGGNESDDEEGFADSDDESDANSRYQFWTPVATTAATSTEHIEQSHNPPHRMTSERSPHLSRLASSSSYRSSGKTEHAPTSLPFQPTFSEHTEGLDNSEFVVGTIDEDGPLEEEYISRRRQREQSKRKLIPQDIDPSFPTSDPESDHDEDIDVEATDPDGSHIRPVDCTTLRSDTRGLVPSPRRLHSPPPPPKRLFGHGAHRMRSPPPVHRRLMSPRSSRRQSPNGSPTGAVNIARLAQRPNLTYTSSLPRTPNPYWRMQRRPTPSETCTSSTGTSPKLVSLYPLKDCVRGPIEIVQGLANKRQRRKEKFWRQHCKMAHAGKEKDRKCQPGKGAQRMREVGLEMADRFKGYKQGVKLILSV